METSQEKYMEIALKEAQKAYDKGEVPVGCVIVKNGEIIAKAHNLRESNCDPCGHAEIIAIQKASKKLGDWQLVDCEMYVTLEPCVMCAGAIIQSRIAKVIYGTQDPKGGAFGSSIDVLSANNINHKPLIVSGVLKERCSEIIKKFFKEKR